jgi:hypothetical protein
MQITTDMLRTRGVTVDHVALQGEDFEKIFSSALLCDWAAFTLAEKYTVPILETPLIAEFKKKIAHA